MYPSTPMPCAKHHCCVHLFKDTKHLIDIRQSGNPLDNGACKTTTSFKLVTDQQLVVWQRRYSWMVNQKSVSCALVQFLWVIISNWDQHRQASKLLNMCKIIQTIQNKLINSHKTLLLWQIALLFIFSFTFRFSDLKRSKIRIPEPFSHCDVGATWPGPASTTSSLPKRRLTLLSTTFCHVGRILVADQCRPVPPVPPCLAEEGGNSHSFHPREKTEVSPVVFDVVDQLQVSEDS